MIKCDPSVSIKGTSRTGAKIADYEKEKGPGQYPYARPRRHRNIPLPRTPFSDDPSPPNIRVAAAASPRLVSTA